MNIPLTPSQSVEYDDHSDSNIIEFSAQKTTVPSRNIISQSDKTDETTCSKSKGNKSKRQKLIGRKK